MVVYMMLNIMKYLRWFRRQITLLRTFKSMGRGAPKHGIIL